MDDIYFTVAKLIWLLIRPEALFVILILANMIALRHGALRLAQTCLGILTIGLIALGILPLGDHILRPLETRYPANPPLSEEAGIIVLGGGETPDQGAH